jgi:SAM-dependent MidA family methyltransferase
MKVQTFEQFMQGALYGSAGFYMSSGFAGVRGDFLTSPTVGPLFGHVISVAVDQWWEEMGCPKEFVFVDAGAGVGRLAGAVMNSEAKFVREGNVVAVEISGFQRSLHPRGVVSLSEFPEEPICGVVVANELLDNLPFRLFEYSNGWYEVVVAETPNGQFVEKRIESNEVPKAFPKTPPNGTRLPLQQTARSWVHDVLNRLDSGRLIVIDYGLRSTSELTGRPLSSWLRTYAHQCQGSHYLERVGLQDITCEVMFDQIFDSHNVLFRTQREFLQEFGIDSLVAEGRGYWAKHASSPNVRAMMMRSRVSEAEALLDPNGLGAFTVAEVVVGS